MDIKTAMSVLVEVVENEVVDHGSLYSKDGLQRIEDAVDVIKKLLHDAVAPLPEAQTLEKEKDSVPEELNCRAHRSEVIHINQIPPERSNIFAYCGREFKGFRFFPFTLVHRGYRCQKCLLEYKKRIQEKTP